MRPSFVVRARAVASGELERGLLSILLIAILPR
jgi:hypothetical protein